MPVLGKFRETLIAKNVASEIADELVESVCTSLEGKTMSSFSRVRSAVRTTLEEALARILTPKSRLEILQEVARVKKEGRPYTIAFVGVNGVGKSTNLSKVCNYLLQNKLNVMVRPTRLSMSSAAASSLFFCTGVYMMSILSDNSCGLTQSSFLNLKPPFPSPHCLLDDSRVSATACSRYSSAFVSTDHCLRHLQVRSRGAAASALAQPERAPLRARLREGSGTRGPARHPRRYAACLLLSSLFLFLSFSFSQRRRR